jgi:ABC-2 type transport system permease protein
VDITVVPNPEAGREEVAEGDLDALVTGNASALHVLVKSDVDDGLRSVLNGISQREVLRAKLVEGGLDPAQVLGEVGATQVAVDRLEPPNPERGQRLALGLVLVFLLFFGIQTYGALVAQGVVEEKSSRVVEILLSSVRPWQLMLGKVLGLGLVGLVQLVIIAVAGFGMASATGVLTLHGVAAETLLWGILWYLLGFFLYATVYAGAGSLVSRQEDTQTVITPVTIVLTIGFVVGLNLTLQSPDGTSARVLSLIPVFSPILMPGRIAAGVAAGWEIALSLVLTLCTIAVLTWLAGKVYHNAILRTGSRIRLTELLRPGTRDTRE